jgi:type II secretory pathway predicted ATPase ExeA
MINETNGKYREALTGYGIRRDPFGSALEPDKAFATLDSTRASEAIYNAVDEKVLLAVIAPAGAGKSTMLAGVLGNIFADCHVVCPPVIEADRLSIAGIQREIVETIEAKERERVPRDSSRRARGTAQTIGHASKPVLLALDEAHLLTYATLTAIKRLWNLPYLGRSPLLSIVLVGQTPLLSKLGEIWELGGRTETIRMSGLTVSEGASYIAHRLSVTGAKETLFTEEAKMAVSRLCPGRTPLALNGVCRRAVSVAYAMGHQQVTEEDVRNAAGVWDIKVQLLRDAQIDIKSIADRAGVSSATVRAHLSSGSGTSSANSARKIEEVIDSLLSAQGAR